MGRTLARRWNGANWCIQVYTCSMASDEKPVRQSVSLPPRLARRVRTIAKNRRTSTNRVLVELIETGIESKEAEKTRFFELADKLSASSDPVDRKRTKQALARMTFGE
jgi:EAL domain-containing protein (putative c-di-GMP-specific phosphodiesterase class I)